VIFAANHQNALMDALAVLFAANKPVYFLARADIFRKKRVAALLRSLKMMPVYRLRDEVDIVKKNEATFRRTAEILSAGNYLGILPEGTHTPIKQLQILKKGICRIAFETIQQADDGIDLHIVPVGLDYSNYHKQGSSLVVIFGRSIPVIDFLDEYIENPNRAVTMLRDKLSDSLKEIMISIDNTEQYHSIHSTAEQIADSYLALKSSKNRSERAWQRYNLVRQESDRLLKLLNKDPEAYNEFMTSWYQLQNDGKSSEKGIVPEKANDQKWQLLLLSIIGSVAILLNFAPIAIAGWLSNRVKDKQFISSFKFVASLILFPLWYLVIFLIIAIISGIIPAITIVTISFFLAVLKLKFIR
jgi:1-acyl-sn-glycerol-3-phosphate acyltransferase